MGKRSLRNSKCRKIQEGAVMAQGNHVSIQDEVHSIGRFYGGFSLVSPTIPKELCILMALCVVGGAWEICPPLSDTRSMSGSTTLTLSSRVHLDAIGGHQVLKQRTMSKENQGQISSR